MHFPVLGERSSRKPRLVPRGPEGKEGIDYSQ
jgi:hypothetical protein